MDKISCVEKIYDKRVVNPDFTLTLWVPSYPQHCLSLHYGNLYILSSNLLPIQFLSKVFSS